jgi:hypothetical protein
MWRGTECGCGYGAWVSVYTAMLGTDQRTISALGVTNIDTRNLAGPAVTYNNNLRTNPLVHTTIMHYSLGS